MEAILKRLLDAELKAQQLVDLAGVERDRIIQGAIADAGAASERFTARIPEIQSSLVTKAQERADQSVGEMQRRHADHLATIRRVSEERRVEAIAAAIAIVLDPSQA